MKYIMFIMFGGLFTFGTLNAQKSTTTQTSIGVTPSIEDKVSESSSREQLLSDYSINDLGASSWSRDVYRIININNEENSPLFYPRISTKGQVGFFSLVFNLIKDGKVNINRFTLDNLDREYMESISLREVMDVYNIPYGDNGNGTYSVNPYDIPTDEILSYYVREKYYFDTKTGKGGVKIVAICPVLSRKENLDSNVSPVSKSPLFWIPFEDVSPYLMRTSINLSLADLSKAGNISYFDLFRRRYYKGDIYQIGNRNLSSYCTTPDELFSEQDRLDEELSKIEKRFNKLK